MIMDADGKLLSAMFRWQVCRPSGWDPRISVRALADQAGLPRSTAWERVNTWKSDGFLQGYAAIPNPLVLGARMASFRVNCRNKEAVLQAASLIDGAAGGIDMVGEELILNFVGSTPAAFERQAELLRQFVEGTVDGPMLFPGWEDRPPDLASSDVPVLKALIDNPEGSFQGLPISERSAKRRYGLMIKNRQVLFRPELSYEHMPGATAMYAVHFEPQQPEKELGMNLMRAAPDMIPFCDPFERLDGTTVPMFLTLDRMQSAASAEPTRDALASVENVTRVEVLWPRRVWVDTAWVDERLASLVSA